MSDYVSSLKFDPFYFDSTLNAHSTETDNECNIDHIMHCECKYYNIESINRDLNPNHCNLSLFHFNARSLNRHANDVIDYLATLDHHFNIYGFTETWFKCNENANLVDLEGYTAINCNREGRTGGGASLFVDNNIEFTIRDDLTIKCDNCDSVFIEINSPQARKSIIGVIYRPETVILDSFFSDVARVFDIINKEHKMSYVMGDYNIDLLKHGSNNKISEFVNLIYSNNFFPCIDRPTRVTEKSATLIDNILTNDMSAKINSGVLVTDITDHFPIFTTSSTNSNFSNDMNSDIPKFERRQMKPNNIKGFKNGLSLTNWNEVYNESNPERAYNVFDTKINRILNTHCPIKTSKVSKRQTPKKPWVTPGLIKSIFTKDKLYKQYITKPSPENKLKYTKFRNILNSLLRTSKKNHFSSQLNLHKNNMKKTWQTLNNILGRNKTDKPPSHFTDDDDNEIKDPVKIATKFNDFFTNIGPSLASKIPPPKFSLLDQIKSSNAPLNSLFLSPCSSQEVLEITCSLKTSNSCGTDGISSKLLKQIIPEILDVITHIFNNSLSTGIVPSKLKTAKVNPVFKSGDKHKFTNYRPISILPSISKLLEKIVYNRIHDFITEHKILSSNQFGFRKNRSTYMAINNLYDTITTAIDNKLCTVGIFLDLSKAFDTLDHSILLQKLNHCGIRGTSNLWIENYLSDRQQFVVFNGKNSPTNTIRCGVPQGSILGPLLFLLYINDLPNCSTTLKFILFADDTNIICTCKDPNTLETILNNDLEIISNWFKLNKLSLNISKTNYMIFKSKYNRNTDINFRIIIDNKQLDQVNTTKFLGILIDDKLSWNAHTTHVCSIISKYNGIIRKVKQFLPVDSLSTLYNTLVYPYLNYCAIIWADNNNSHRDSILLLQKKIVRTCTNSLWLAHSDPLFLSLKTLKIQDLYTLQLAIFMYQFYHGLLPCDLLDQNYFTTHSDVHNYNTRYANDIRIGQTNTKLAYNTIRVQGALLWNSLQSSLKNAPSIAVFKQNMKKHLIGLYDSSDC